MKINENYKQFQFQGKGWQLLKLFISNFFLTLITFGIYFFWGKARLHRFFYYYTTFDNGNFDFHATGKELFILFLKSLLIIIPVLAGFGGLVFLFYKSGLDIKIIAGIVAAILYAGIFTLIPLAVFETRKFMLARTSWNLKYFSFDAGLKRLYKIYLKGFLLSLITLGIYSFWFRVILKKYLTNYVCLDQKYFSYRGNGKDILLMTLLAMFLIPLTLGLYIFWFIAKLERYHWSHTFYDHTRFQSCVTGGGLFKTALLNFFQTLFTLGIGFPWAIIRQKKYYIESLVLTDETAWEEFQQEETQEDIRVKEEKNKKVKVTEESLVNEKPKAESVEKAKEEESNEFMERYGDFFE